MMTRIETAAPVTSVTNGTRNRSSDAGTTLRTCFSMTVKSQAVMSTPMMPPNCGVRAPKNGTTSGWAGIAVPSAATLAGMPPRATR